jgi:hypothetical protein
VKGVWEGTAAYNGTNPYLVHVEFSDATYSARCLPLADDCVAFYYGTEQDSPYKQYELLDINAANQATGNLWIVFFPDAAEPGNLGAMDRVELSSGENDAAVVSAAVWTWSLL